MADLNVSYLQPSPGQRNVANRDKPTIQLSLRSTGIEDILVGTGKIKRSIEDRLQTSNLSNLQGKRKMTIETGR